MTAPRYWLGLTALVLGLLTAGVVRNSNTPPKLLRGA
jgi:hypothetical protein